MCAVRLWVSMPQSRVSPASSSLERSTTEKQAASSLGSATAYGEAAEPGAIGRQGRESARDRTATSSYSSDCRMGTSASCRARSPTLLLRSTPCSYLVEPYELDLAIDLDRSPRRQWRRRWRPGPDLVQEPEVVAACPVLHD